jgi:LmbE family N-acetylglucosaminyl deacetylase
MQFSHPKHNHFVPDAAPDPDSVSRTTHLGIGAHQDDLEFMAIHGILECFGRQDLWFGGIICTDGAGSVRTGHYAGLTDEQMRLIRSEEQRTAATIGQYAFITQLAHPSAVPKNAEKRGPMVDDIEAILKVARPDVVYIHNPFDKHPTHIGAFLATLEALRRLPKTHQPEQVFGCEVWRGLDWLPEQFKVLHDVSAHPDLVAALSAVFDSQIAGGKRYDAAVAGRRLANATFLDAHSIDSAERIAYAIDLGPLVREPDLAPRQFVGTILEEFATSITEML